MTITDSAACPIAVGGQSRRGHGVSLLGLACGCLALLALVAMSALEASSSHLPTARSTFQRHPSARLPISLTPVVSTRLGAAGRSFWPVSRGASVVARGGGIHASFTRAGARLSVSGGRIRLDLSAIGRGRHLSPVAGATPQTARNEVLYRRGAVEELYRNGPLGLEQVFTVSHDPRGGRGPLVLRLKLEGSLAPEGAGAAVVFRTRAGAAALRYSQLSAADSSGRPLPARIELRKGALYLRVDDRNARYPVLIDPFIAQQKLTGKEESGPGELGTSVALSADGGTALVGAPKDNESRGAAWVFKRSGTTWTEQAKLTGKEESGSQELGTSVALSADGRTALIGAGGEDKEGAGAAWVFTYSESKWTQQKKLMGAGETGHSRFGYSVSLSSDGNTALVGGFKNNSGIGAAWVFTRSESKWTQQQELTGGGESGVGFFGYSVALAGDGKTALVGGYTDSENVGAAWVFTSSGSTWTQQAELKGEGETANGVFGSSVALSSDGSTALIGGYYDSEGKGAAWVFKRTESSWAQQAKLTGLGEVGQGFFGSSVALSSKGDSALVGGNEDSVSTGAVWVFRRAGSTWSQQGAKLFEAGQSRFGNSVALSGDGKTALIGGTLDSEGKGAAWVFITNGAPSAVTGAASSITQTTATLNATVNPNGFAISECKFEYGTTTAYGSSAPCSSLPGKGESPVPVSAAVTGLSANTTYHFRIVAVSIEGVGEGADQTFKTLPNPPTVVTGAAGSITQTTVTLNATVNPNGGEVTECKFEYGTTTTPYGSSAPCSSLPGTGESPVAVSAAVTGLKAETVYHVRISATNAGGTGKGSDEALETTKPEPPTVVTGTASSITQTTATLNATVNPNGGEVTECRFEYGTSEAYGSTANCTALPGAGSSSVAVSAAVTGLTANATYHFRISAENPLGARKGSDQMFKALPNPPTVVTGAAGSIEQTTAILNATVHPNGGKVSECKFEYGPTAPAYGSSAPCTSLPGEGESAVAVTASLTGLTANRSYHFRISATNAGGTHEGADGELKTLPNPPTVVTGAAGSITQTTATLNATVNPNGGKVTECKFEYGPTAPAYGSSAPCTSLPGEGESPVAVSGAAMLLEANTTYHFRIVAINAGGKSEGSDQMFKALPNPPTVVTGAAISITQTTASLGATVNPNGGEVSECKLEYGTSISYTASATCSPAPGSGEVAVAVSGSATSLKANTTYHFRVVAMNAGGKSEGSDQTFTTLPNPPTVLTGAAGSIFQTTATLNATVNPNGGEVSECKLEYGTSISYTASATCSPAPGSGEVAVAVSGSATSLEANTTYHFRVVAMNAGGKSEGSDQTFKTLPNPPTVVTGAAISITQTTATLNATVNPNGGKVSECKFEYGTTTGYGSSAPCASLPGEGEGAVAVSAAVSGLSPETVYHFRVSATNAGGAEGGTDRELTTLKPTPPTVATGTAAPLTQTTATLNATVNPNGGEVTECRFEYGPTAPAYGSTASCKSLPGKGSSPVAVSAVVTGLAPNASYHFRVFAKNALGEETGGDQTFTTLPNPPTVVTGAATSITQTTATLNATVNPNGGKVSECKFEYGPTNAYGSRAVCGLLPGPGSSPVELSASLTGLTANTTYHFRVVAGNAGGQGNGSDHTLTTEQGPAGPSPGGGMPPAPEGAAKVIARLASRSLIASASGVLTVKVKCPAGGVGCAGTLTVRTMTAVLAGVQGRQARGTKTVLTLTHGPFSVAAGQTQALKLHLASKGRSLLLRTRVVRVRVAIVEHLAGVVATTETLAKMRQAKR